MKCFLRRVAGLAAILSGAAFAFPGEGASQTAVPQAQSSQTQVGTIQVEARGGLTVGSHTASWAALDIAPAVSFDLVVRRQMWPSFALFAGYYRTAFGCEEGYCTGRDITVTGNHGAFGAEWGSGGAWLRLGALFGTTSAGTDGDDPEMGAGILGAAGLTVGSGRVRFLPGVSYRWMSANSASDADSAIALALDIGFRVHWGQG